MADETEHVFTRDELLQFYKQAHINKCIKSIKKLNHHGREYLNSVEFKDKFVIFEFTTFIKEILKNNPGKATDSFSEIQQGFLNLEQYGIKLLQCPWRKEYYSIKLYTSFFKHDIEPRIPSSLASSILCLYGYTEKTKDVLELKEPVKSLDKIVSTAFELFLGSLELEVMQGIAKELYRYTDDFTLSDIIKARQRTVGGIEAAVKYLQKRKGFSSAPKKIKLDNSEQEDLGKDKREVEGSNSASYNSVRTRSFPQDSATQRTTHSPGPIAHNLKISKSYLGGAKAEYVGSFNGLGLLTDEELYGVQQGEEVALSDAELYGVSTNHTTTPVYRAMEVEEEPKQSQYDPAREPDYEDMSENNYEDAYEIMSSSTLLKPPSIMKDYPPPTYSEATNPNFPEWVVIEDGQKQKDHDVSNTIPGLSGLNISENGASDRKGEVDDQYLHKREIKKTRGMANGSTGAEMYNMEYLNSKGKPIDLTTLTTTTTTYTSSSFRDKSKMRYPKLPDSKSSNGYSQLDHKTPRMTGEHTVQPERGLSASQHHHSRYHKDKTAGLDLGTKRETPQRIDSQSSNVVTTEPGMTNVLFPPSSKSQSAATQRSTDERLAEFQTTYTATTVPEVSTVVLPPSSNSKRSSAERPRDELLAQSSKRELLLSQSALGVEIDHRQSSSDTQNHSTRKETRQNACVMCPNAATHSCTHCSKLCCLNCINMLNRLLCDGAKVHHIVERGTASGSKDKEPIKQVTCANCKKPSTHECRICNTKSCQVCQFVSPFKDQCISTIGHVFVMKKSDMSSFNGISLDTEIQKDLSEQNICDQCGMAAKFICADCHNRVCKDCLDIFKKDLCPATKKEHFFHVITAQTKVFDTKKAEPWSCERCTYLNPPENRICSVCATSRGVSGVEYPESGSRRCGVCTFGNKEGARICAMCNRSLGLDKAESYL